MNQHLLPWTVQVANLETSLRVGIWEHEKTHQVVNVSMIIESLSTGQPVSIDECINYEPICRWLIDDWPQLPHTELIETRILELAQFIFRCDWRIRKVDLSLSKPDAYPQVQNVGMRLAVTRDQFALLEQARRCRTEGAGGVRPPARTTAVRQPAQSGGGPKTSEALVPPKPKEFDNA